MTEVSTQGVSGLALHLNETDIHDSLSQQTNNSARTSSLPTAQHVPRSPTTQETFSPSASASSRPTPLPAFTFPMKSPTLSTSPRSAPSSFSRATGRRPMSAIELNGSVNSNSETTESDRPQLPEFSFGGNATQTTSLSPRDIPSRSAFHKRGASEFIGGDGKTGHGTGLMSTSPTKGDNMLPAPSSSTFGPPAGRRGHAHRRSAAMSCHDLSMILKPDTTLSKGGASAPTSPSTEQHNVSTLSSSIDSAVRSTGDDSVGTDSGSTRPFARVRVAFSDNVETIPRPLSVVSSDSASTVKQGHSVSNSMSSIISADPPVQQSSLKPDAAPSPFATINARPRTAELYEDLSPRSEAPQRRNSIPLLHETTNVTNTGPLTPRSAKKWGFFGPETTTDESSLKSRPSSSNSAEKVKVYGDIKEADDPAEAIPATNVLHTMDSSNSRRSSVSRKPSKKPKKVRSWAGSILSRKSRQRSQKQKLNRRSPTPPLRAYTDEQESLSQPIIPQQQPYFPNVDANISMSPRKPRRIPSQEELSSPMIDLDAALGPFNTPTSPRFGEEWETAQRGGTRKRTMHSAINNTSYLHRRAESAPEFENPRFGLHRLGSSSTMGMEDVFEEDEEDEWEDAKTSDKGSVLRPGNDDDSNGLGIDIKVVDSDSAIGDASIDLEDDSSYLRGVKRKGSGLSDTERRMISSTKSEHSNRSIIDEPIAEEPSTTAVVETTQLPLSDTASKSSDKTATPPLRPAAKELAPVDFYSYNLQPPYPTPTSPRSATQSSFPSPRSPFSYDTQRISTAPSSVTDEQSFQSLLLGEPGPEVRSSVDGVPSLTSSASTTMQEGVIPQAQNPINSQFREGQRSSSMSAAAISRKRSSMASLSRLISSSHGEKSKLSIESRPSTSEGLEKKEKPSRGKRISRLMQFWKPKEP